MGGYLVCDKCKGFYELQPGESPDQFSDKCECGGELKYAETLKSIDKNMEEMVPTISCPRCGMENPEDATLCKSCKRFLKPIKTGTSYDPPVISVNNNQSIKSHKNLNERTTRWTALGIGLLVGLISYIIVYSMSLAIYVFGLNIFVILAVFIAGLVTILVYPSKEDGGTITGALAGGITILIYIIVTSWLGIGVLDVKQAFISGDFLTIFVIILIDIFQIVIGLLASGAGAIVGAIIKGT